MKKFATNDLATLKFKMGASSRNNDLVIKYLNSFNWDDVYTTADNTTMYEVTMNNGTDLSLEFTNLDDVYKRKCFVGCINLESPKPYEFFEL